MLMRLFPDSMSMTRGGRRLGISMGIFHAECWVYVVVAELEARLGGVLEKVV